MSTRHKGNKTPILIVIVHLLLIINTNKLFAQPIPIDFNSSGGGHFENYHPLEVNDRVPDIPFLLLDSSLRTNQAKLSDFKEKLVILDFWGTWCYSCISEIPKLDTLQKRFGNQLRIVLLNSQNSGDTKESVSKFFLKRKDLMNNMASLTNAVEDSVGALLFPHNQVPHCVWIGNDGRVKAITTSHEVNSSNLEAMLNHEMEITLPVKRDLFTNQLLHIPFDKVLMDGDFPMYRIFRKGQIEGLQAASSSRSHGVDMNKRNRGWVNINQTLPDIYLSAIGQNFELRKILSPKLFILDVNDSSELVFDPQKTSRSEWNKKNLYTYDIFVPVNEGDSLYTYMMQDLNHYSGYYGRMERRNIKCLALVRTSKQDKIKTKGTLQDYKLYIDEEKRYAKNIPIEWLVHWIDNLNANHIPTIDETGYKNNIDLDLTIDFNDMKAIKRKLATYDLDLVEVERKMNVFVVSKK